MNGPLSSGQLLGGRYQIRDQVGSGGWATVYRALDTSLGRTVAIKVLHNQFEADPEFVRRFRQEAQAAASLSHPHVVSIYDVGEEAGTHFIVMEYVDGITLRGLLEHEGRLDPLTAAKFGAQLLDALEHAHENGIVHRDITPRNILLTRTGRVKVTDFGIARAGNSAAITHSGSIYGSAPYISPEQARGGATTSASDLYSAGIVLYEMVTGQVPFQAESPVAVALKHIEEEAQPPHELNPAVPPDLERIVLKALHKDGVRRYQKAADMRQDLSEFVRNAGGGDPEVLDETLPLASLTALPQGAGAFADNGTEATQTLRRDNGRTPAPRRRRVRPTPAFWIGLASILVIVGGAYWTVQAIANWLVVPDTTVPELVGLPQTEAQEQLKQAGLVLEIAAQLPSDKPFGQVLSQEPAAGEIIKTGREVLVKVSAGPRHTVMPDLRGWMLADVQKFLSENGLREGRIRQEHDPTQPQDTVLSTQPGRGETVIFNQFVDIIVSTGKAELELPDLVGEPGEAARDRLVALNFKVDINEVDAPGHEPGVVIELQPAPGTKVVEGDRITLTVSKRTPTAHTLAIIVPKDLPDPVRIRVEVYEGDGIVSMMHDGLHKPGDQLNVELHWSSPGARYAVLANGQVIETGTLP